MGLFFRLTGILLIALLPIFGAQVLSLSAQRQAALVTVRADALHQAAELNDEMGRIIGAVQNAMVGMAAIGARHANDSPTCQAELAAYVAKTVFLGAVKLVTPDGMIICGNLVPHPARSFLGNRPAFQLAVERRAFTVGSYVEGKRAPHPELEMGYPVYATDGTLRFVLIAGIDLAWLRDTLATRRFPPDSTVTMADRDGIVLLRQPNAEMRGRPVPASWRPLMNEAASGTRDSAGNDGVSRVVGYIPLTVPPEGIFMTVGFSIAAALAPLHDAERNEALAMAAALGIALFLIWWLSCRLTNRPILGNWRASAPTPTLRQPAPTP